MKRLPVIPYSNSKEGSLKVSEHFRVREFRSKDGDDTVFISPDLVTLLEDIREHFGKPVYISSGYRTTAHNRRVGGVRHSQHLYGYAADIKIKGVTPEEIAAFVRSRKIYTCGVGIYRTFCHVDVRPYRADWRG